VCLDRARLGHREESARLRLHLRIPSVVPRVVALLAGEHHRRDKSLAYFREHQYATERILAGQGAHLRHGTGCGDAAGTVHRHHGALGHACCLTRTVEGERTAGSATPRATPNHGAQEATLHPASLAEGRGDIRTPSCFRPSAQRAGAAAGRTAAASPRARGRVDRHQPAGSV